MSRTPARAAVRRRRRAGESHHFSFRVTLHTFLFTQYTREPNQGAEAELIQWPRQAATLVIDRCSPVSTDRHPDRACTRSRRGRATRRPRARKPARLQDAWAHRRLGTGGVRRCLLRGGGRREEGRARRAARRGAQLPTCRDALRVKLPKHTIHRAVRTVPLVAHRRIDGGGEAMPVERLGVRTVPATTRGCANSRSARTLALGAGGHARRSAQCGVGERQVEIRVSA